MHAQQTAVCRPRARRSDRPFSAPFRPAAAQPATAGGAARRAITIVVPYASGGPPHFVGRLLGVRLSRLLGEPVVVENRPGQSGLAGTCYVGRAAAGWAHPAAGDERHLRHDDEHPLLPLRLHRGAGAGRAAGPQPLVLCVPAASPLHSLADLTQAARRSPGALRYITPHAYNLPILMLADMLEINVTSVLVGGALPGSSVDRGDAEFALLALGRRALRAWRAAQGARRHRRPAHGPAPRRADPGRGGLPGFEVATDFALFARARHTR